MLSELLNDKNLYEQSKYYDEVKKIIKNKSQKSYAFVKTYGCQQNVNDSEKIKGILFSMGYELTNIKENADLILFNTCAIREHAEDKVFGNVGALKALKRKNPSLIIVLCGCMMEQNHIKQKIKLSFPFVNIVFGTNSLNCFPKLLYKTITDKKRVFEKNISKNDLIISENIPIKRDSNFKAWLPIMYGCDNFCSYCVVPYVRGRERSRLSKNILNEVQNLISKGYKEITLLGQNVNSYGKNLDENINFWQLLNKIDNISGDYWIRFMTSHPKDATKEMIDTIANSKHICKHIHLPVQCGNNRVLSEMKRRYTVEKYFEIIDYAKKKIPGVSFTSDIIVGFPGETYSEFCDTINLIKKVEFTSLFTFIYSKREGTKAAHMDDPIPYEEKLKWFNELLKVQEQIAAKRCKQMVGKCFKVLFMEQANNKEYLVAKTEGNISVEVKANKEMIGKFSNVEITNAKNWVLEGKII